jgi:hypothetical protein
MLRYLKVVGSVGMHARSGLSNSAIEQGLSPIREKKRREEILAVFLWAKLLIRVFLISIELFLFP